MTAGRLRTAMLTRQPKPVNAFVAIKTVAMIREAAEEASALGSGTVKDLRGSRTPDAEHDAKLAEARRLCARYGQWVEVGGSKGLARAFDAIGRLIEEAQKADAAEDALIETGTASAVKEQAMTALLAGETNRVLVAAKAVVNLDGLQMFDVVEVPG